MNAWKSELRVSHLILPDVSDKLLEYLRLTSEGPSGSIGLKSLPIFLFLMLIFLPDVKSMPLRSFLVGITQSNISSHPSFPPLAFQIIHGRGSGHPLIIWFVFGRIPLTISTILYISPAGSPTDNHQSVSCHAGFCNFFR